MCLLQQEYKHTTQSDTGTPFTKQVSANQEAEKRKKQQKQSQNRQKEREHKDCCLTPTKLALQEELNPP